MSSLSMFTPPSRSYWRVYIALKSIESRRPSGITNRLSMPVLGAILFLGLLVPGGPGYSSGLMSIVARLPRDVRVGCGDRLRLSVGGVLDGSGSCRQALRYQPVWCHLQVSVVGCSVRIFDLGRSRGCRSAVLQVGIVFPENLSRE